MSIARSLFDGLTDRDHDLLYNYGCYSSDIEGFLETSVPFLERQQHAIKIVEVILAAHGKERLLDHLSQLAKVELSVRELQPWARDHVVHAVLTFILGAYLNERFLRPRFCVDSFQWKLSGLLHDVAYPIQIGQISVIKPFANQINRIRKDLGVPGPKLRFVVVPENLEMLSNDVNAFDLLQSRIEEWGLDLNSRKAYRDMLGSDSICHGMLSGLALMLVLDMLYQKYNPKREYKDIYPPSSNINFNQRFFENDIVSACSAVFIHNLDVGYFADTKITRSNAPLAFLLRLSDSLQDWERPSQYDPHGIPADRYDIRVEDGKLVFKCDIPADRKERIQYGIHSVLDAPDVVVC